MFVLLSLFQVRDIVVIVALFLGGSEWQRMDPNRLVSSFPSPCDGLYHSVEAIHAKVSGSREASSSFNYCHHTDCICMFFNFILKLKQNNPSLSELHTHGVQITPHTVQVINVLTSMVGFVVLVQPTHSVTSDLFFLCTQETSLSQWL